MFLFLEETSWQLFMGKVMISSLGILVYWYAVYPMDSEANIYGESMSNAQFTLTEFSVLFVSLEVSGV